MRSTRRIMPFLLLLSQLWLSHPDLRFSQVLLIVLKEMGVEVGGNFDDVFYTEDKDWEEAIYKIIDREIM